MVDNNLNLKEKIIQQTKLALEKKALHSIPTKYQIIEQNNISFIVRIVDNLNKKDNAKKEQKKMQKESGKEFNPFLPYEQDLYVSDLGENHVCLLNKFNVIENHLLIITREFEPQINLISQADFAAMWMIFQELDGFTFYNAGKIAGASQPHKHLQFIPYPFAENIETIPIDKLILNYQNSEQITTIEDLPYQQAIAFFPENVTRKNPEEAGKITLNLYYQLLTQLNLNTNPNLPTENYNLLITKKWLMVIPRSQAEYKKISVNSLGFAGALLVKNQTQLEILMDKKPLHILQKVGIKS